MIQTTLPLDHRLVWAREREMFELELEARIKQGVIALRRSAAEMCDQRRCQRHRICQTPLKCYHAHVLDNAKLEESRAASEAYLRARSRQPVTRRRQA